LKEEIELSSFSQKAFDGFFQDAEEEKKSARGDAVQI
jgi:hypothetical protein